MKICSETTQPRKRRVWSNGKTILWYIRPEIEDRVANNWAFEELLIRTDAWPPSPLRLSNSCASSFKFEVWTQVFLAFNLIYITVRMSHFRSLISQRLSTGTTKYLAFEVRYEQSGLPKRNQSSAKTYFRSFERIHFWLACREWP